MSPHPQSASTRLLTLALLLAALGCLKPASPVTYHTLNAVSLPVAKPGPGAALAVEVLPVRLPDMLQRPQLVTALGPDRLALAPGQRWGNALEKDMQRVLVENLTALLGSDRVVAAPYGVRVNAAFRVEVEVQRCEGRPGGPFRFQATWMITAGKAETAVVLRKTVLETQVPGPDAESLVAAHNAALATLSREIAAGLTSQP